MELEARNGNPSDQVIRKETRSIRNSHRRAMALMGQLSAANPTATAAVLRDLYLKNTEHDDALRSYGEFHTAELFALTFTREKESPRTRRDSLRGAQDRALEVFLKIRWFTFTLEGDRPVSDYYLRELTDVGRGFGKVFTALAASGDPDKKVSELYTEEGLQEFCEKVLKGD